MLSPKTLLLCGSVILAVNAAPGPAQVKGGLTIVSDNDLTNVPDNTTAAALLIEGEYDLTSATTSCRAFSESLFPQAKLNTLNNSFAYFTYSNKFSNGQQFWLAQTSNTTQSANTTATCQSVTLSGTLAQVACTEQLPVLCTQSAPVSTAKTADKSARFQVSQQVGSQTITGFRDFYSFRFLGIRFAPQPQRFTYSTVYDGPATQTALNYGSKCAQPPGIGSEDCLFLNVFTPMLPSNPSQENLKPVMVWIHGGGFKTESNQDINHDGTNLASRGDVVVVQLNYRLGNLGFLTLNNNQTTGNYGISDLITGLQWVKKYASAFRGDADKVTIFGESAGGAAVRTLLGSPKADGLFHNAIMMSSPGGVAGDEPFANWSSVAGMTARVGDRVLQQTGCANKTNQLACLRAYDGVKLANLSAVATYPVNDHNILNSTGLPLSGLTEGTYVASVPLIIGFNRDEGGVLAPYPPPSNLTQAILDLGTAKLGNNASTVLSTPGAFLPLGSYGNRTFQNLNLTSRIVTDGSMRCDGQALALAAAKHNIFPSVYVYQFNRTYQPPGYSNFACNAPKTAARPDGDPDAEYLKCHAGEMTYVSGAMRRWLPDRDGKDTLFARLIVDYWSAFARTGNPNPNEEWLTARGYQSTLDQMDGNWTAVNANEPRLRWLEWGAGETMVGFQDLRQCEVLGVPVTRYG